MQHPALAHSQRKNEMSGTASQLGCAPAVYHSLVSPSGASTTINQQPLLLLAASSASWSPLSGNAHVGLGWFPSSCAPVCHRRSMERCLSQVPCATRLVPHAGQGCSNSRFKAAVWGGNTSAKQPRALARDGGKQEHPLQLVLHPSSLPQHSQTFPHPHGLLQEILLFSGMFLSKIALIGIRKKKEIG